jgi:hypothetical protein
MVMAHTDLSDTHAIIHLLNLYGVAVDTQRWEWFDEIFIDDVDADFSEKAHWHDLNSFKSDFALFHDPFDNTQHVMSNHLVKLNGDSAHSFTYGSWRLVRKAAEGAALWDGTGWYDDAWQRTALGWRISRRTCRVVHWTGNPFVNETIPGVKFELNSSVLRREVAAGTVGFFAAISK